MKNVILMFTLILALFSCKTKYPTSSTAIEKDNIELAKLYASDQSERNALDVNWEELSRNDSLRQARIHELIAADLVKTSNDYANAAMIFQHGNDTLAYGMVVKMMEQSIALNPERDKWLLAAGTDRYLLAKGESQIYGTQYKSIGINGPVVSEALDSTIVTDKERKEFGVETLVEQRAVLKEMNSTRLFGLVDSGVTTDEIITFIREEDLEKSKYNLSEYGINDFGYILVSMGKFQDALKIFDLNIELYPSSFNVHNSYGDCCFRMGNKKAAIAAYTKTLDMDAENSVANKMLLKLKEEK